MQINRSAFTAMSDLREHLYSANFGAYTVDVYGHLHTVVQKH